MDTHNSRVKYGISATPVKEDHTETEIGNLVRTGRSISKEKPMRSVNSAYLSQEFMTKHLNSTKAKNKNTPGIEENGLKIKSFKS